MPNGLGRFGILPDSMSFSDFAKMVKEKLNLNCLTIVGNKEKTISKVGLCTGAGFEFIEEAKANGCDCYITADVKFHEAQKALNMDICLIDATHYGTENIIVPVLRDYIQNEANEAGFEITVKASDVNGQVFDYIK